MTCSIREEEEEEQLILDRDVRRKPRDQCEKSLLEEEVEGRPEDSPDTCPEERRGYLFTAMSPELEAQQHHG